MPPDTSDPAVPQAGAAAPNVLLPGEPPPPVDAAGLKYFTVELPNQEAFNEVVKRIDVAGISSNQTDEGVLLQDPSQNGVMLILRANG